MKTKRPFPRFWAGLAALMVLVLLPWIIWEVSPAKTLSVAVVDKTVNDGSYREHKGLFWILDQQKYRSERGEVYRYDPDYYGDDPAVGGQQSEEQTIANLPEQTQLIYVADTYGLAERRSTEDIESGIPANAGGREPISQQGGMKVADVKALEDAAARGTMLVAEFNSIAAPTDEAVRDRASELFGMKWTGWTARYFPDLTAGVEVPDWVPDRYLEITGRPWNYTGTGFLFVQADGDLFVLREGAETDGGARIAFTEAGQSHFDMNPKDRYNYWFDIVAASSGSEVLAAYDLQLTSTGRALLAEHGVREYFPAVIRREATTSTSVEQVNYYFAGDYADRDHYSFWRRYAGWPVFKSWFTFDTPNSEEAFYWDVYVPMMKKVLNEASSVQPSLSPTQSQ